MDWELLVSPMIHEFEGDRTKHITTTTVASLERPLVISMVVALIRYAVPTMATQCIPDTDTASKDAQDMRFHQLFVQVDLK